MVYRSFKYKHLQKTIARLGLQDSSAFSCISEYLFKPKPAALDLITQYTSVMALPTVFSVGIHVRTGDQSMKDAEYDKVNTGASCLLRAQEEDEGSLTRGVWRASQSSATSRSSAARASLARRTRARTSASCSTS